MQQVSNVWITSQQIGVGARVSRVGRTERGTDSHASPNRECPSATEVSARRGCPAQGVDGDLMGVLVFGMLVGVAVGASRRKTGHSVGAYLYTRPVEQALVQGARKELVYHGVTVSSNWSFTHQPIGFSMNSSHTHKRFGMTQQ